MGKLYICGTPIGNLDDVSIRLLKTLRKVDLIACEDTRQTVKILNRFKIKTPLTSYHEHSSKGKEDYLLEELLSGKNIALVSDAGMPLISDPGENLVKRVITADIDLEIVPGPSALICALALSGLDSTAFIFEGFLPNRSSKRREALTALQKETRTIILYEAPHRLSSTLKDIEEVMGGDRPIVVARELTKKYEEMKRGSVGELRTFYEENPPRGEICILIAGEKNERAEVTLEMVAEEIDELLEKGLDKKEAFKMKAKEYGIKKSAIYNYHIKRK
ncbi:MAG: 16S rRNA (cytidine(1402)-2'-O)-methyltransferase [Syntrophomonadaceae bacterium]|nr:16S rRNA (cytidine(1402)-2'-O)-methyltransferase [Syntrophomonadaceae bacterium]MDD3890030.1 16S rRNA (cytidine(1402)-2'-O)-methyltransferase [Syntrophomonadaceae bacterium]MDD4549851.1 16S rRNA (cytidine(1402)-2'-O)-methyltransferase [Syntrophomonadaceae bacterium]